MVLAPAFVACNFEVLLGKLIGGSVWRAPRTLLVIMQSFQLPTGVLIEVEVECWLGFVDTRE